MKEIILKEIYMYRIVRTRPHQSLRTLSVPLNMFFQMKDPALNDVLDFTTDVLKCIHFREHQAQMVRKVTKDNVD
jgi:hypothetical protein